MSIRRSESIKELAAALAKAQGIMLAARMESVNPFLKYKYADLGSVIQAARLAMSANGLSFTQHPELEAGAVTVTTLVMHSSGEWIESDLTLGLGDSKGLSLAQSMGVLITYMRRYTLSAILGIYAGEDTDGNGGETKLKINAKLVSPASISEKRDNGTILSELGVDPEPAKVKPWTSEFVTLETAMTEKDSKGDLYWTMTTPELSGHMNNLLKSAKDPSLTPEQQAVKSSHRITIQTILAYRQ